jgi:hypothetical protein
MTFELMSLINSNAQNENLLIMLKDRKEKYFENLQYNSRILLPF